MDSFNFAGFSFPRPVANMAVGFHALKAKRELRKVCGGYMHAPTPNQCKGWGLYDEPEFHGLRIERTGASFGCDDLDAMHAFVVRLPHARGFLVGWTMGAGMCMSIDGDLIADEDDARCIARSRCEDAALAEYEFQESQCYADERDDCDA